MSVKELNESVFDAEIASGTVVVDFWAPWCGPCKMMAPIVDALSETYADVKWCKINVDEAETVSGRYNVMSIPTIVCFKDGKESARSIGYRSQQDLVKALGL